MTDVSPPTELTHSAREFKLYELADAYARIEYELLENGGELTEDIETRLNEIADALEVKVERMGLAYQQLTAKQAAVKQERQRLQKRERTYGNAADSLKDYLHRQLQRVHRTKVETPVLTVRRQKNSRPSIRWCGNEDAIPEEYRRVQVSLDGTAAYEAWRQDALPEIGFEVEQGEHLRIY